MNRYLSLFITCLFMNGGVFASLKVQEIKTIEAVPVRLVEDHTLPVVSMVMILQAGDLYDPLTKSYLTGAVMDLLGEGTETLKANDLKQILLDKGIQLNFLPTSALFQTGRRETLIIQLRTTTGNFQEAMEILHAILLKPRFETADLKEWQERTWAMLLNVKKNPDFIAENHLRQLVYGASPWGVSYLDQATEMTLKSITPLDVRSQWFRFLTLDRIKIGVCGDITPQDLQQNLTLLLKGMPASSSLEPFEKPSFPQISQQRIIQTSHPQGTVRVAHPGLERTHENYALFALMTRILGEGMSSRLFMEIREKQGLVYNIGASLQERLSGSLLFFGFETKSEQVPGALTELQYQLRLLKDKGVTLDEFKVAKSSLLGSLARGYASTIVIAQRLAVSSHFEEPQDFHEVFQKQVEASTLSQLNDFIKNFIQPERLQIVMVGRIPADEPQTEEKVLTPHDSATNSP